MPPLPSLPVDARPLHVFHSLPNGRPRLLDDHCLPRRLGPGAAPVAD